MAEVEEGDPPERDVKVCTNSARKCDSRGWSVVELETDILLGSSQQRGNTFIHTYLTSLPLVSVYCRGHVPGWKSRWNFNSSTNSISVCAQFTLWQMHWTNLSVSIQATSIEATSWRLKNVKTSYENCRWIRDFAVTTDSKSSWQHGGKVYCAVFPCC